MRPAGREDLLVNYFIFYHSRTKSDNMLVIFYCTAFLNDVKGWQKRCLDSKKRSPNIQEMLLKDTRAIYNICLFQTPFIGVWPVRRTVATQDLKSCWADFSRVTGQVHKKHRIHQCRAHELPSHPTLLAGARHGEWGEKYSRRVHSETSHSRHPFPQKEALDSSAITKQVLKKL
ncbi:MAG: hypothetical protein COY02_00660 [Parcubacteria group bacterium CG_4_10_14_0_2_um_filter_41_6]|nr:MAG: hypothetical protein COY02_00660 [Parcubacteria group bacterium CG_4_10_14_0_2_um_filter_41_6]